MIDVKELRIGNVVRLEGNSVATPLECEVTGIQQTTVRVLLSWERMQNIHPVPITVEWLEKLGFEKGNLLNGASKKINIFFQVQYVGGAGIMLQHGNEGTVIVFEKIKYIHQLQNLLHALTGEELTIKT